MPVDANQEWDTSKPAPAPQKVRGGGCRDAIWALLFIADFAAVVVLAIIKGAPALREEFNDGGSGDGSGSGTDDASVVHIFGLPVPGYALKVLCISFLSATLVSALAIRWLQNHAEIAINVVLIMSFAFYGIAGAVAVWRHVYPLAAPLFVFALLGVCFYFAIQKRVRFAAANLSAACAAVREYPATLGFALLSVLVQFLWVITWSLAMFGVVRKTPGDHYGGEVFMLFSLLWGQQVVQYVMFCTVAGTVGSWWFNGTNTRNPTLGALKRALTTSFGSIAFGAALLAIISTMRALANNARRHRSGRGGAAAVVMACLACFAACMLRCLEDLLRFWNRFAFVYVAVYGKSYCAAGKEVSNLFMERGWSSIINTNLVDTTLMVGSLGVGAVAGLLGAGLGYLGNHHAVVAEQLYIPGTASVAMGFFVALCCSAVISAAVTTVFVCFASAPEALSATNPEHFANLLGAWLDIHPKMMLACGYTRERFTVVETRYT